MIELQESDSEIGESFDLFDGIGSVNEVQNPTNDPNFWANLKTAQGENQLGNIVLLSSIFSEQLKPSGQNNGGLLYVCASPMLYGEDGYRLYGSRNPNEYEGSVPVYWMPWVKGQTVYARRDWFEDSMCDYFMTTQLSGCRFVVTGNEVLHIASDVNYAPSGISGRSTRNEAERAVTGGAYSRRLSFNGGDDCHYAKCSLVFGMRRENGWQYKALRYELSSPGGDWITLEI